MSIDTLERRSSPDSGGRRPAGAGRLQRAERRDRGRRDRRGPAYSTLGVCALVAVALMTVDARSGAVLEPVRAGVGQVLGPAESAVADVVRPFVGVPSLFTGRSALRADVARLERQNAGLRQQLETTGLDRNRLAEYDGLARAASDTGYTLVPAHVVAMGPAQSFSRTVTIDAGTRAGLTTDTTVVADDGLVGRVIRAGATTSTVLLIVDDDSVVGGRVASNMQVGVLDGRGGVGGRAGELDLGLVDDSILPGRGDTVVSWGSRGGAPYVGGIPIGRVTSVVASPRDSTQHAVVSPYVDFGALDLVGVVVPAGTRSDRALVTPDGVTERPTGRSTTRGAR